MSIYLNKEKAFGKILIHNYLKVSANYDLSSSSSSTKSYKFYPQSLRPLYTGIPQM